MAVEAYRNGFLMRVPEVGQMVLVTWDTKKTWHEKVVSGVEEYDGPSPRERTVRVHNTNKDYNAMATYWYWPDDETNNNITSNQRKWRWKPIETSF